MSGNVDRARSKLQLMTTRQLENLAARHGVTFDTQGRKRAGRKQMAAQLSKVESVVEELG